MQIQGTGDIGSTKRKFHLSGVPLTESRLYIIQSTQSFVFMNSYIGIVLFDKKAGFEEA